MQKTLRRVLIAAVILVNIITGVLLLAGRRDYTFYIRDPQREITDLTVTLSEEGIVEHTGTERQEGFLMVHFRSLQRGTVSVTFSYTRGEIGTEVYYTFEVNGIGSLSRKGLQDFNGWNVVWGGIAISMVLVSLLLIASLVHRIRTDLYSYKTLMVGGFFIFFLFITLTNLVLCSLVLPNYRIYNAGVVMSYIRWVFAIFVMVSTPFVLGFAAALTLSNLALIRREGFRPVNLLGIICSTAVLFGAFAAYTLPNIVMDLLPSSLRVVSRVQYILSGLFCFGLCFMLSTMVCALIAALRVPPFDRDYIIVLGCSIRPDGTLKPLLQGRVDRAIRFRRQQLSATGKRVVLVPSGGKGADEVISEGEAMRRYMLQQGVPAEDILPETASKTTLQNMANSKAMILERDPEARVAYSTTNYHVFRSGILAGAAGLKAEGMGSRTRWYFWPNAFAREFLGLLFDARRTILVFFCTAALFFIILSILL